MDKKTKGSWLIHHTNKLQRVSNHPSYEKALFAGKAGILLSAISADQQMTVSLERVKILAQQANIDGIFQLNPLLEELENRHYIERVENEIAVLGVTTSSTLMHTTDIFDGLNPSDREAASLSLAEKASQLPISSKEAVEEIGDIHRLSNNEMQTLLHDAEQIGFVDVEKLDNQNKLFFNGNLFRRDTPEKIKKVLSSLTSDEEGKIQSLSAELQTKACIELSFANDYLGDRLFKKMLAIGLFDVNTVANSNESVGYITLPSSFSKYGRGSIIDDAFDLAKAFVSSITYGMTKSSYERGQIRMVEKLLECLVQGQPVGPVKAIDEDYRVLERRGVVKVYYGSKKGRTGPMLKLLKKDIGELALQVIRQGDVSENSLQNLPSASVTMYTGPEENREQYRRAQLVMAPKDTNDALAALRTGNGF